MKKIFVTALFLLSVSACGGMAPFPEEDKTPLTPQGKLNVHPHPAGGVCMGVLMEQGLVPLHRPVGVQQGDLAGLFGKGGPGMSLHAGEQPAFPQG